MKKISVIGSCVCRDLFESDNENFSFYTDFRFFNPISILSKPLDEIKIDFDNFIEDVDVVGGNWYKKNIINDVNKTAFKSLQEKHGEYLVMDFQEARISIARLLFSNNKSLPVSYSTSFKSHYNASLKNNALKNAKIEIINPLEYSDDVWRETIKEFSQKLLEIFNEEKIILIRTRQAREYVDVHNKLHPYATDFYFSQIMLTDILMNKLNDMFISFCPKCKVIDIPEYAIGSQTHKWGNHPLHFTPIVYEYLLECVKRIALFDDYDSIKQIYDKYSILLKEEYKKYQLNTSLEKNDGEYSVLDLLKNYEDFNKLGRRKKAMILFALDKKHFFSNIKKI